MVKLRIRKMIVTESIIPFPNLLISHYHYIISSCGKLLVLVVEPPNLFPLKPDGAGFKGGATAKQRPSLRCSLKANPQTFLGLERNELLKTYVPEARHLIDQPLYL